MPYPHFSGNRTVGAVTQVAVTTVTCPLGEVGTDSAECLVNRQWNNTLNPQCTRKNISSLPEIAAANQKLQINMSIAVTQYKK